MASQQITKRLICGWKGCDDVFEEAAAFKEHVDKHFHEYMQTDLDKQAKDGTEEQQQEDEPLALAKVNEDKTANGVDIGKRKLVFLAVEIWTDILGFVKRIQLARTVSLTNWQIHQICWPRLHGNKVEAYHIWEDITIIGQERSDQDHRQALVLKQNHDKSMEVPMPSCPPPSYISGFHSITIKFLDQQVLAFFTHILPCLAKDGVSISLDFDGSDAKKCAMLDQLLNKFRDGLPTDKLHAICCPLSNIQYLPNIDNKMKMIDLWLEQASEIPILMKMLASPRPDGQQRVIQVYGVQVYGQQQEVYLVLELIKTIKEDFRASTQPLAQPYYIGFNNDLDVQRSVEKNEQTGEQLTIMPMPTTGIHTNNRWEICRHPRGQHEQWAENGRERVELAAFNYDERDHSPIYVELE